MSKMSKTVLGDMWTQKLPNLIRIGIARKKTEIFRLTALGRFHISNGVFALGP